MKHNILYKFEKSKSNRQHLERGWIGDLKMKFSIKNYMLYPILLPCQILGIIYSINCKKLKQNIKYKIYRQWGTRFLREKPSH